MIRYPGRLTVIYLLFLGGCRDYAIDKGSPPPVLLTQTQRYVVFPATWGIDTPTRNTLRQAIRYLGPPDATEATINAPNQQAAETRTELLGQGVDPDRIRVGSSDGATSGVLLTHTNAAASSCNLAVATTSDPVLSLDSIGRCVQENNLAEMLVDPQDLVQSPVPEYEPADRPVKAIQELNHGSSSGQGAGSGTASSGGGAASSMGR